MLKPFYMLEGNIDMIKEIKYGKHGEKTERHWEDDNGHRAITIHETSSKRRIFNGSK